MVSQRLSEEDNMVYVVFAGLTGDQRTDHLFITVHVWICRKRV